ncbi:MAG TPA: putative O-glycosylation ligase, exosortase A system-associated [Bryobacteraceae bacterium]
MQLRDILFTSIMLALIAYAFRRPWVAILIWAWLSYMNPHRLCYGFAAYNIPWTTIAAILTIGGLYISGEKNYFPWTRETVLLTIFCLWMTVTTLFGLNQTGAWPYLDRVLKIQAMIFVTFFAMKGRFRIEALVWVMALSIAFWGVKGGLWTLLRGGGGHVEGPVNSMIFGNNELALALVMVLPMISYLQLQNTNKRIRWALTGTQILCVVGIVGTYSRAGFLALCVMWALQWWKSRHKLILAMAVVLVAPPIIYFMPHAWLERMHTITNTSEDTMDGSVKGRLNAWRTGINIAKDHPIVGGGFKVLNSPVFAQYSPDPKDQHDAHSIYIETLTEQGFPGFLMFMGLGVFTWFTHRRVVKMARRLPELQWASDLVTHVQLGLIGYAVGGAFAGLAYFDLPYHMMSVIVLCGVFAKDAVRAAARASAQAAWEAQSAQAPPELAVQEA